MSDPLMVTSVVDLLLSPFKIGVFLLELQWLAVQYIAIAGTFLFIDFLGFGVMSEKENGSCPSLPMDNLKWNVDSSTANRISCHNRKWAEARSYAFDDDRTYLADLNSQSGAITFFDSVNGKAVFKAPVGRTIQELIDESEFHGWPSFRDEEVVWDNVE